MRSATLALLGMLTKATGVLSAVITRTIFTLPGPSQPSSWFENLAVRPNGKILATRGDAPEIWQIDPATGDGSVLVSLPPATGAFNLTGIAEIPTCKRHEGQDQEETYVFGSSHIPAPLQVEPGSAKVWTLKIDASSDAASTSLLASLPDAGFVNGFAAWDSHRVLVGDTEREAIYLMDVETGAFTTPLTGLTGVNGVQAPPASSGDSTRYYVYRADHASLTLSRIPVDRNTAEPVGSAEILVSDQLIDDFAVKVDAETGQGKAYMGAMYENSVVEVDIGSPGSQGMVTTVAENLTGSGFGLVTVVVFGRRAEDQGVLYAAVGQGEGSASIVAISGLDA